MKWLDQFSCNNCTWLMRWKVSAHLCIGTMPCSPSVCSLSFALTTCEPLTMCME
jgi:hypothetical protein